MKATRWMWSPKWGDCVWLQRSSTFHPATCAMYYPEANALVPRRIDPESGTPAFKSVLAHLEQVRGGS